MQEESLMKYLSVSCALLVVVGLSGCGESEPVPQELTVVQAFMQDHEAVNRGQALFIGTCAGYCHKTTPVPTDAVFLFDCEWKHGSSDQEIFDIVTTGVPGTRMVGYGSNFPEGEDDLWKIIAYLRVNQQPCS